MSPILRSVREQLRPSDLDRLVHLLRDGGVAILPTDTVYGLVGKAFDPNVFRKLDNLKGERRLPYAVIFPSVEALEAWHPVIGYRQRRVIHSLMPGPVTLVVNAPEDVADFRYRHSGVGVRVIADPFVLSILQQLDSPIWASSANRSGEPAPNDFRAINKGLAQEVDMVVDSGPTTFHEASTVADLRTPNFTITREGPWMSRVTNALKQSEEPLRILTVCSGNICRSPIAAYLLQKSLREAGCVNVVVESAGLDAMPGLEATSDMVQIGFDWGIDLSPHRARQLTFAEIKATDILLVVSPAHQERVVRIEPSAKYRTFLMAQPLGMDTIRDPYHGPRALYKEVAETIRTAMDIWSKRIVDIVAREYPSAQRGSDPGTA